MKTCMIEFVRVIRNSFGILGGTTKIELQRRHTMIEDQMGSGRPRKNTRKNNENTRYTDLCVFYSNFYHEKYFHKSLMSIALYYYFLIKNIMFLLRKCCFV